MLVHPQWPNPHSEPRPHEEIPTNRPCRLAPAHQGLKTVALIGGVACASFATHTPPLDSRFRGNDELGGRNDENAEWRGSTARSKAA